MDNHSAGPTGKTTPDVVAKHAATADEQNDRWESVVMCRNDLAGTVDEPFYQNTAQSAAGSDCTTETRRASRVHRRKRHPAHSITNRSTDLDEFRKEVAAERHA